MEAQRGIIMYRYHNNDRNQINGCGFLIILAPKFDKKNNNV